MTTEPVSPVRREPVNVVAAAAELAAAAPVWLWATGVDGEAGGEFTAQLLDEGRAGRAPAAFGGDVVIALGTVRPSAGPGAATVTVTVHAVAAGQLVPVAVLEPAAVTDWPEQARPAVSAAMGVLAAVSIHADLLETVPVSLGDPARAAVTG